MNKIKMKVFDKLFHWEGGSWLPIDMAPKDGTPILVAIESVHNPDAAAIARWVPAEEKWVTDGNRRVLPKEWHPIPKRRKDGRRNKKR